MYMIYIILINYNKYQDTIECVNSLRKMNYCNYKIIIVDNNSINNSVEILKQKLNDCIVIESKKNIGFAGGNNLGIKFALDNNADMILLLNNDTVVKPNFLDNLIEPFKKHDNIGIIGCKILYYSNKNVIWYAGGKIDWFKFFGIHYGNKEIDNGQYNKEKEVDFITGCCMLIKKEVFQKVGLLSDEYFMYFEDMDFCVRTKEAGYKLLYNPSTMIYHKVGLSSGGENSPFTIKWCTRNKIIFMKKFKNHVTKLHFLSAKYIFYIKRFIKYLQYNIKGEKDRASAIKMGILSARKFKC